MCQAPWQEGAIPQLEGDSGQTGSLTGVGSSQEEWLVPVEGTRAGALQAPRGSWASYVSHYGQVSVKHTNSYPSPCSTESEPPGEA